MSNSDAFADVCFVFLHCLNILECLCVCPSILHKPLFSHAVDVPVICHHCSDWYLLMCWCSIIGSLTDLRTTAEL